MKSEQETRREFEIGKHSRITLGVAWAILAVVVSGAVGGVVMYDDLRGQVRDLRNSQLTRTDDLTWIMEFGQLNPQLKVPVPRWTEPQNTSGRIAIDISNTTMAVVIKK